MAYCLAFTSEDKMAQQISKLDIIDEFKQLGLIDKGEVSDFDKEFLLSVYSAKLAGKFDCQEVANKAKGGFKKNKNSIQEIYAIHELLTEMKKNSLEGNEKLGGCRSFENSESRLKQNCVKFIAKKQEYEAFLAILGSDENLKATARRLGVENADVVKKVLLDKKDKLEEKFYSLKATTFSEAIDHLVWLSARVEYADEEKILTNVC